MVTSFFFFTFFFPLSWPGQFYLSLSTFTFLLFIVLHCIVHDFCISTFSLQDILILIYSQENFSLIIKPTTLHVFRFS